MYKRTIALGTSIDVVVVRETCGPSRRCLVSDGTTIRVWKVTCSTSLSGPRVRSACSPPVRAPGHCVPSIRFLILALYICLRVYIICLFISFASPFILFSSLFPY